MKKLIKNWGDLKDSDVAKSIIFTVTNDLTFDQRMHRICGALSDSGFHCTLLGREKKSSLPLDPSTFDQKRLKCWFQQGKLFYIEYNIRLFFFLLRFKCDIICSIDMDSLVPGYFASRIKGAVHVYDAHELFSEMEEVISRPAIQQFWLRLERWFLPNVKSGYTVSEGFAALFKTKYGIELLVIRNVPSKVTMNEIQKTEQLVIYQGALNVGRGLEESIEAMLSVENCRLHIVGDGPELSKLKNIALALNLHAKVVFTGSIKPEILKSYTAQSTIGLTLFSSKGLHHRYSLANRFFDYINASLPQVAMNYPEYEQFNNKYQVAILIDSLDANSIATAINKLLNDHELYAQMKANCRAASIENNWEMEKQKLINFYNNL